MNYHLLYFASLADAAGCGEERIDSPAATPAALYAQVRQCHGFVFDAERLRVAVNGVLVDWDHVLADEDQIVFLPPVSGG
ncbi:MAG: MoaD/ThiS family protein [Rhodanobacteraceae bacterium]